MWFYSWLNSVGFSYQLNSVGYIVSCTSWVPLLVELRSRSIVGSTLLWFYCWLNSVGVLLFSWNFLVSIIGWTWLWLYYWLKSIVDMLLIELDCGSIVGWTRLGFYCLNELTWVLLLLELGCSSIVCGSIVTELSYGEFFFHCHVD